MIKSNTNLKKRKEVSLDFETLTLLETQAKQAGRSLKNYLEFILTQKANDFKLSNEYKTRIDEFYIREVTGRNSYAAEEDIQKRLDL